jgi:diguanylate cyclase (GGDEF)-like protein
MDTLTCGIKKLLKKLEVLETYEVERLVIEHIQKNLNLLDELQRSYQHHYLRIIQTLLQQLAEHPRLKCEPAQKRLAFLNQLVAKSPTLSDLETLHQGLKEFQAMLGSPPALPPSAQFIGDPPLDPHLLTPLETQEARERIQSVQRHNDHFAKAVEKILELIDTLKPGAPLDLLQRDLKTQAMQLIHRQHQLASRLDQLQQQLSQAQAQNERLKSELQHAKTLSLTDELTQLPNRRAFWQRAEEEIKRVQRHPSPLTLALLDLDRFKQINDLYGHAVGDEVLRTYAKYLQSTFRRHDYLARFGGEEFILLLPSTDITGSVQALVKLREKISGHILKTQSGSVPLPTFSAGVTQYNSPESIADFIQRADSALYRAKQAGRDRIESLDAKNGALKGVDRKP